MPEHRRHLFDVLTDELCLRNYSPNTIKASKSSIESCAHHFPAPDAREKYLRTSLGKRYIKNRFKNYLTG
ncbi:MAG TPA: hypothetical protein VNL36_06300 [Bacteroidota bacterium]|nr:hypothetical protein [Bacteroidota bacterium]